MRLRFPGSTSEAGARPFPYETDRGTVVVRGLRVTEPDDVAFYPRTFEELAEVAALGEDAGSVIVRVLNDFSGQPREQTPQLLD